MSSEKLASVNRKTYTSLSIKDWILQALDDEATKCRWSRSTLLEFILEERYMKEGEKGSSNGK